MKKIAIITGASSGIGSEFVKIIDKKELHIKELWLVGRNIDKLKQIASRCTKKCRIISLDLTKGNNLNVIRKLLSREDVEVDILVNSAGLGFDGMFTAMNYINVRDMIRVNIEALTSITYNCLPKMKRGSRIINVASAAAFLPQPVFAVYGATKSYVYSFTRALRVELKSKGILVTAVCPGPVNTKFFNNLQNKKVSIKSLPRANAFTVAYKAYDDNLRNKEVSTYSGLMNAFRIVAKIIPHTIILKGFTVYIRARNWCK